MMKIYMMNIYMMKIYMMKERQHIHDEGLSMQAPVACLI